MNTFIVVWFELGNWPDQIWDLSTEDQPEYLLIFFWIVSSFSLNSPTNFYLTNFLPNSLDSLTINFHNLLNWRLHYNLQNYKILLLAVRLPTGCHCLMVGQQTGSKIQKTENLTRILVVTWVGLHKLQQMVVKSTWQQPYPQ